LGGIGGAVATLLLTGFALGWCARAVHGQENPPMKIWKCAQDVVTLDERGKPLYHAHGWLEMQVKDGGVEKLHRTLVAVRASRREALHDCADYLADKAEHATEAPFDGVYPEAPTSRGRGAQGKQSTQSKK